ncbi:hypothetical protein [Iamia sp.]|uniref:hypothetical protein n=1 Tax=Iamia sp. TaxID=2722710 RepID=UPI002BE1AA6C|nr:hypothetical protein [Iamia sp.]HXH56203.1 hypothetical protein [Iamia sp.]
MVVEGGDDADGHGNPICGGGGGEEDPVAEGLDQAGLTLVGAVDGVDELVEDREGGGVAVDVGEGGEPGQIQKGDGGIGVGQQETSSQPW